MMIEQDISVFDKIKSFKGLANSLRINEYTLKALIKKPDYYTFDIKKKSGDVRKITAPRPRLKSLQQKLLQILSTAYTPKPAVHGFLKNRNIVTNARAHTASSYILNIDLKDFFPSITIDRVRELFRAPPYNKSYYIANIIAQLVCYNGELPQGAPTSPIISNMICFKLDAQLQRLAKKHGCFYTRYADDITFSTKRRYFPSELAYMHQNLTGSYIELGKELLAIIENNRFSINFSKVRLQRLAMHQEVTGLTVNEFPNVNRKYIKQLHAMLHAWEKFGYVNAENEFLNKYNKTKYFNNITARPFSSVIKGKLEFLGTVRGKNNPIYLKFWYRYLALSDPNFVRPNSSLMDLQDLPDIFISYSRKNFFFVKRLYENLSQYKDRDEIWLDTENIVAGTRWTKSIDEGLLVSRIMILVITPESLKSNNVRNEYEKFLSLNKTVIPLIAYEIDRTTMPSQLSSIQDIMFHNQDFDEAFKEFLNHLNKYNE